MKTLLSFIGIIVLLVGIGYLGVKILHTEPIKEPAVADDNKKIVGDQVAALNEKVKDKLNQMKKLNTLVKPAEDKKGDVGKDKDLSLGGLKAYGPIDEEDKRVTGEILQEQTLTDKDKRLAGEVLQEQTLTKDGDSHASSIVYPPEKPLAETESYQYKQEDLKRLGTIRELYVKASEALEW
jgi:hypothetical protein